MFKVGDRVLLWVPGLLSPDIHNKTGTVRIVHYATLRVEFDNTQHPWNMVPIHELNLRHLIQGTQQELFKC